MSLRRLGFSASLLACALVSVLSPAATVRADSPPRVLAFYYAWFDANTWNRNLVSDLPAQPYASSDPAVIARQIDQARGAGIDAFVVSWIGTDNPTDWNFKTMLAAARGANFQATIDFETQHFQSREAVIAALAYVRDRLMPQPAFLRQGDRPVLFFWREQQYSVGDWAAIRQAVDPDHRQLWIAEGTDISYQQVFDGHHLYSIAWSGNVRATLNDWAGRVRRAGPDRLWVATVMPGYDDTRTGRPDRFVRARDNGNFYRAAWQAAINSRPDLIIVNSFNEWVEGSMIEPSVSYGNLYLDITREYAALWKSGAPAAAPAAVAIPKAVAAAPALLKADERRTTDVLRVRYGPGLSYSILGRLRAGRTVSILGRNEAGDWLQIAFPDADHPGWVSAEYVAPSSGLDQFPVVRPEPLATASADSGAAEMGPGIESSTSETDSDLPPWY